MILKTTSLAFLAVAAFALPTAPVLQAAPLFDPHPVLKSNSMIEPIQAKKATMDDPEDPDGVPAKTKGGTTPKTTTDRQPSKSVPRRQPRRPASAARICTGTGRRGSAPTRATRSRSANRHPAVVARDRGQYHLLASRFAIRAELSSHGASAALTALGVLASHKNRDELPLDAAGVGPMISPARDPLSEPLCVGRAHATCLRAMHDDNFSSELSHLREVTCYYSLIAAHMQKEKSACATRCSRLARSRLPWVP
jgi:hypothetical protein